MTFPVLPLIAALALTGASCPTHAAHVDTSVATTVDVEVLGDDFGQTFVARDSFLTRVVLWQPLRPDSLVTPTATLLIYDADSTGTPILRAPLLTGPTIPAPSGNGGGKVALVFDLSPAIRLPHLGWFDVAFLAPCGERLWMLHSNTDILPKGHEYWNRAARCPWWSQSYSYPGIDVMCDIELCDHDPTVPPTAAVNMTWGRLKTAYR